MQRIRPEQAATNFQAVHYVATENPSVVIEALDTTFSRNSDLYRAKLLRRLALRASEREISNTKNGGAPIIGRMKPGKNRYLLNVELDACVELSAADKYLEDVTSLNGVHKCVNRLGSASIMRTAARSAIFGAWGAGIGVLTTGELTKDSCDVLSPGSCNFLETAFMQAGGGLGLAAGVLAGIAGHKTRKFNLARKNAKEKMLEHGITITSQ